VSVSGTAIRSNTGTASMLASGAISDICWNIASISGSIPSAIAHWMYPHLYKIDLCVRSA
jgi:hypothetical protein